MAGADRVLADRVDALTARLGEVLDHLERLGTNSNTQRVLVQQSGIGPWQIAAVASCFFTMFALIIALVVIVPDIHDLRAWRDIHSAKIARLEVVQEHKP